jgi:hypothetical protein
MRCFGDMRRDNARECTGCVGATDTGQLPATSGFRRHVKSGSCDIPLRCAAGSAQRAAVGRRSAFGGAACGMVRRARGCWSWEGCGAGGVCPGGARETWEGNPTGRRGARGSGEQQLVRVVVWLRARCLSVSVLGRVVYGSEAVWMVIQATGVRGRRAMLDLTRASQELKRAETR